MGKKVVSLGELMLRLSTVGYERFLKAHEFEAYYGGGEANVAISLAEFGHDSNFVTKLPNNDIAQSAINMLKQYNINTDYILRGGDRMGLYFSETGASMRPSKVIYDRIGSSFSMAKFHEFDFDEIFKDCALFHVSGITPALSESARELTLKAIKIAKDMGCIVSYDYNYRSKLWSREECDAFFEEVLPYIDVLIGYIPDGVNWDTDEVDHVKVAEGFKEFSDKYNLLLIASTLRNSISASDNELYAVMYDGVDYIHSKTYKIRIVNRIGGGDAFSAGLISELLYGSSNTESLEFAVAASAWKHTILGDHNIATRDEILKVSQGDLSGKVQR